MTAIWTIFRRELAGYFATPVAYVFITVFLGIAGALTFYVGAFLERGQADLQAFFSFHPWLYLFLVPAIAMRLWAEERKAGTVELLLTLPVTVTQAVIAKFLAAWAFCGIALALTFPLVVTVNLLGNPDNGVIVAGYIGSFLMAGAFLAIGACMSAVTKNQVIAFVLTVAICAVFAAAGSAFVQNLLRGVVPDDLIGLVAAFSFQNNFSDIIRGVIDVADFVFFASMIVLFLFANAVVLELKKAD